MSEDRKVPDISKIKKEEEIQKVPVMERHEKFLYSINEEQEVVTVPDIDDGRRAPSPYFTDSE